jgi:hypothetical protein
MLRKRGLLPPHSRDPPERILGEISHFSARFSLRRYTHDVKQLLDSQTFTWAASAVQERLRPYVSAKWLCCRPSYHDRRPRHRLERLLRTFHMQVLAALAEDDADPLTQAAPVQHPVTRVL